MPRTPKSRSNGQGTIYQRASDGLWVASVTIGFDAAGKQVRRSYYGPTRPAVRLKLDRALVQLAQDRLPDPEDERLTVARWLERWLKTKERDGSPRTHQGYAQIVRDYLVPHIGRRRLAALSVADVSELLDLHRANGVTDPTRIKIRGTLRAALSEAQRRELVDRNVAALTLPIEKKRRRPRALSPDHARAIAAALQGDPHEALLLGVLGVGLRISEALGLTWQDLDLPTRRLYVRAQLQRLNGRWLRRALKTDDSEDVQVLPAFAAELLARHRADQLCKREQVGADWIGSSWDLVFTSRTGRPLSPAHVREHWNRVQDRAALLPRLKIHDLRKATGTLMLARGVDLAVISAVLRHSSIRMTADIYAGVSEALKEQAAAELDRVFRPSSGE